MTNDKNLEKINASDIAPLIYYLRGEKIILDFHLAELYNVPTKRLIETVKRNLQRFPDDFMFQLSDYETEILRSQFATSRLTADNSWGGRRYNPYAFTEHGVTMLSSVLNSQRAININIEIIRTFIKLRRLLLANEELSRKLASLERRYDSQFKIVFDAIRELMKPPDPKKKPIGFGKP